MPHEANPWFVAILFALIWIAFLVFLVKKGSDVPPDQPG